MFTGIVEAQGTILDLEWEENNLHLLLSCPFNHHLKIDQSLSHNGICLTVTETGENHYRVTAIRETLEKTNLGLLRKGDRVNLERCMAANGRFDGHIVQGHVDTTGICIKILEDAGSHRIWFSHSKEFAGLTVEKGSVCVNGISLTVVDSEEDYFSVAIIPYTWENTNLGVLKEGDSINLEFDILGKYIRKIMTFRQQG
jgi:riboflavin synthase